MSPELAAALISAFGAQGIEAKGPLRAEPVAGGDLNEAYRVPLGPGGVAFVKTRPDAPAGSFEAEARGLALLGAHVRVPEVLATGSRPPFLALRFVRLGRRGDDAALGEAIADLHAARVRREELPARVWLGPLELPNRDEGRGEGFFALRIAPILDAAASSLRLGARDILALERVYSARLKDRPADRLLHGDLWSGNAAFDDAGVPVLFDPAVAAGDPEADLAMMGLFGGFSPRVWAAYRSRHPQAPCADGRRPCYELFPLLVHHALFGGGYTDRVRTLIAGLLGH